MASYRLSDAAAADLDHLYEYGVLNFGLAAADDYFDGLLDRFQAIANQPLMFPAVDEIRKGIRRCVHRNHLVFFRIDGTDIVIMRILGQQNAGTSLS